VPKVVDLNADWKEAERISDETAASQKAVARVVAIFLGVVGCLVFFVITGLVVVSKGREDPPVFQVIDPPVEQVQLPVVEPLEKSQENTPRPGGAQRVAMLVSDIPSEIAIPSFEESTIEISDFGLSDGVGNTLGFSSGEGGLRASFLGLRAQNTSRHIVLLIDVSGSMIGNCGQDGLEAIKREVRRTVNAFDEKMRFNLVTFAGEADAFRSHSVSASAENKEAAVEFFSSYYGGGGGFSQTRTERFGDRGRDDKGVEYVAVMSSQFEELRGINGGTRVELGIIAAMKDKPTTIFVISDGDPGSHKNGERLKDRELIKLIEAEYKKIYRLNRVLRIHTISVDGLGKRFLKKISRQFGGDYKSIRPAKL